MRSGWRRAKNHRTVRLLLALVLSLAAVLFAVESFLYALRFYEVTGSGEGTGRRRGVVNVVGSFLGQYASSLLLLAARPFGLIWPFPPASAASSTAPPVLLVHGYGGNRANMLCLAWRLRRAGFGSLFAVNYAPFGGTVLAKARRLAAAVEEVIGKTGAARIDLVAHSLGGIVARYYIRELGGAARVRRLVTLGTPHRGTRVAAFAPDPLAQSLRPGSRLLTDLERSDPVPSVVSVTAIHSTFDAKILPAANAYYPGAFNVAVDGIGHDALLLSPKAAQLVIEALSADEPGRAATVSNP